MKLAIILGLILSSTLASAQVSKTEKRYRNKLQAINNKIDIATHRSGGFSTKPTYGELLQLKFVARNARKIKVKYQIDASKSYSLKTTPDSVNSIVDEIFKKHTGSNFVAVYSYPENYVDGKIIHFEFSKAP